MINRYMNNDINRYMKSRLTSLDIMLNLRARLDKMKENSLT